MNFMAMSKIFTKNNLIKCKNRIPLINLKINKFADTFKDKEKGAEKIFIDTKESKKNIYMLKK
jgi:hypothetical protein